MEEFLFDPSQMPPKKQRDLVLNAKEAADEAETEMYDRLAQGDALPPVIEPETTIPSRLKFKLDTALTKEQIERGGGFAINRIEAKESIKKFPHYPTINIHDGNKN